MPLYNELPNRQYITPVSTPYGGYMVSIPDPVKIGRYVRKAFCGKRFTNEKYLELAIAWRDETYQKLYGKKFSGRIFHRQQTNSVTAIPGVQRLVKKVKKKTADGGERVYEVPCILAEVFTVPGSHGEPASGSRSKVYSITKYGEAEAIELAKAWRAEMIERLKTEAIEKQSNDGRTGRYRSV